MFLKKGCKQMKNNNDPYNGAKTPAKPPQDLQGQLHRRDQDDVRVSRPYRRRRYFGGQPLGDYDELIAECENLSPGSLKIMSVKTTIMMII